MPTTVDRQRVKNFDQFANGMLPNDNCFRSCEVVWSEKIYAHRRFIRHLNIILESIADSRHSKLPNDLSTPVDDWRPTSLKIMNMSLVGLKRLPRPKAGGQCNVFNATNLKSD